jgi:hypothetical protein
MCASLRPRLRCASSRTFRYYRSRAFFIPQPHCHPLRRLDASDASGVFEDRPSVTFPYRNSLPVPDYTVVEHTETKLLIVTPTLNLSFVLTSPMALDCQHLNVTFWLAENLVTACFGEAVGRTPLDPNPPHTGMLMDEWTDIVLGAATVDYGGNLNGSVDTTDCYEGADLCFNTYLPIFLLRLHLTVTQVQFTHATWSSQSYWLDCCQR